MKPKKLQKLLPHSTTVNPCTMRPIYIEKLVSLVSNRNKTTVYRQKKLKPKKAKFGYICFTGVLNSNFQQKVRRLTAFTTQNRNTVKIIFNLFNIIKIYYINIINILYNK